MTVDIASIAYVQSMNRLAEDADFSVSLDLAFPGAYWFGHEEDRQKHHIFATWRGSPEAFRRFGFLPPTIHRAFSGAVTEAPSTFFLAVCWPLSSGTGHGAMLDARVTPGGADGEIQLLVNFGPVPNLLTQRAAIQVIEFDRTVVYCGSKENLTGLGMCEKLPGKRNTVAVYHEGTRAIRWRISRYPDGLHVYTRETEAERRKNEVEDERYRARMRKVSDDYKEVLRTTSALLPSTPATTRKPAGNDIAATRLAQARGDLSFQRFIAGLKSG